MATPTGSLPRYKRPDWDQWYQCTRKHAVYASRGRAEQAVDRLTSKDRREQREGRAWTAYHCRFCGSYHVGHVRKVEPCGLCDVPHRCHCPRLKSWCDQCLPLGAER